MLPGKKKAKVELCLGPGSLTAGNSYATKSEAMELVDIGEKALPTSHTVSSDRVDMYSSKGFKITLAPFPLWIPILSIVSIILDLNILQGDSKSSQIHAGEDQVINSRLTFVPCQNNLSNILYASKRTRQCGKKQTFLEDLMWSSGLGFHAHFQFSQHLLCHLAV